MSERKFPKNKNVKEWRGRRKGKEMGEKGLERIKQSEDGKANKWFLPGGNIIIIIIVIVGGDMKEESRVVRFASK
jgi:hypothetical protein